MAEPLASSSARGPLQAQMLHHHLGRPEAHLAQDLLGLRPAQQRWRQDWKPRRAPGALNHKPLSRVNPLGRFATTKVAGEGPQVVAGDNLGAATRKVSHPATRSPISTEFS